MAKYIITQNQITALTNSLVDLPFKVANGPIQLLNHIVNNQELKEPEKPEEDPAK